MSPRDAQENFDLLVEGLGIVVLDIDDRTGALAVEAFERYGKGRGKKAGLNLADCMTYACARLHRLRLLYVGDDFSRTDIESALPSL